MVIVEWSGRKEEKHFVEISATNQISN